MFCGFAGSLMPFFSTEIQQNLGGNCPLTGCCFTSSVYYKLATNKADFRIVLVFGLLDDYTNVAPTEITTAML